jgi:hypothetical protein
MKTLKAAVLASVVGGSLLLSGPLHAVFRGEGEAFIMGMSPTSGATGQTFNTI